MTKWWQFARKVHRLLVLIMSIFVLIMAGTGLLLKYSAFTAEHLKVFDLGQVRYVHNNLSLLFTIVLAVMAVTGLMMYFLPAMIRRREKLKQPPAL